MNIFQNMADWATRSLIKLSSITGWAGIVGPPTSSGMAVSPKSAISNTAIFRAVVLLAESIAQLPLHVIDEKKRRQKAYEHHLYEALSLRPNPAMSSFDFRFIMVVNLGLRGNFYAEIVKDKGGRRRQIIPWRADRVTVLSDEKGGLWYRYTSENPEIGVVTAPAEDMLHVKFYTEDGINGKSPIQLAREAVGLSLAVERYGAGFFGSGGRPTGVLTTGKSLKQETLDRLRGQWTNNYEGAGAKKTLILEEGMDYKSISLSPEDSQFIATRKFQISEVARMFGVPPHMLADLEKATFSNIEHQSIDFVRFSLLPWIRRIEQEMTWKLLDEGERKRYSIWFNVDGLLRGDTKSRYESYAIGKNAGFMTVNEIREYEGLPPVDGGDKLWVQANTMPADVSEEFWKAKSYTGKEVKKDGKTNSRGAGNANDKGGEG